MNGIQLNPLLYGELSRVHHRDTLATPDPRRSPFSSFMGVQIASNPMFPMHVNCGDCSGTGEADDGADCRKCRATGGMRVEGYMGSPPTIITGKLPRLFSPRFPRQLVALPPISRGLA